MYKNPIWLIFLTMISFVALIFIGFTVDKIVKYSEFKSETSPSAIEWYFKRISKSKYLVAADFEYSVKGQIYQGRTIFKDKVFLNSLAVESALDEYKKNVKIVSYNPSKPSHSTINRRFPVKMSLYSGILLLMIFYFFGLGFYLKKVSNN